MTAPLVLFLLCKQHVNALLLGLQLLQLSLLLLHQLLLLLLLPNSQLIKPTQQMSTMLHRLSLFFEIVTGAYIQYRSL